MEVQKVNKILEIKNNRKPHPIFTMSRAKELNAMYSASVMVVYEIDRDYNKIPEETDEFDMYEEECLEIKDDNMNLMLLDCLCSEVSSNYIKNTLKIDMKDGKQYIVVHAQRMIIKAVFN